MKSDALGVHPDQVKEETANLKRLGCPTEFTEDGRAVLTGPRHRKQLAEINNIYDLNGGYSDPQPSGFKEGAAGFGDVILANPSDEHI